MKQIKSFVELAEAIESGKAVLIGEGGELLKFRNPTIGVARQLIKNGRVFLKPDPNILAEFKAHGALEYSAWHDNIPDSWIPTGREFIEVIK